MRRRRWGENEAGEVKPGALAGAWFLLGALCALGLVQAGLLLIRPTPLLFYGFALSLALSIGGVVFMLWVLRHKVVERR